jgi:hypothetical protein
MDQIPYRWRSAFDAGSIILATFSGVYRYVYVENSMNVVARKKNKRLREFTFENLPTTPISDGGTDATCGLEATRKRIKASM